MSIYAESNRCDLYKGDYRPATLYQGEQFLAGAVDSYPTPIPAAIKGTYNDSVALTATGKGKQAATTGANLFDKNEVKVGKTVINLVQTQDGFSFVANEDTATKSTVQDIFLKVGTYFLSGEYLSSDGLACGFAVYDTDTSTFIINSSSNGLNKSFTIAEEKTYSLRFYSNYNSVVGTQVTYTNVMLNTGDSALPYEPYTGGKPSPSLDYPQELVASEGTVTAAGANILDVDNADMWRASNCTRVNGGFRSNITGVYYCTILTKDADFIAAYFKPGETFTFSVPENPKGKAIAIILWGKRADGSNSFEMGGFGTRVAITVPNDFIAPITGIELRWNRATTAFTDTETFFSALQLEKGGTPTPCTKYRPPTSINLPVLRAIPDNNGGWLAQDILTPVPHMPGWYDLKRQVGTVILDGTERAWIFDKYFYLNIAGKPPKDYVSGLCTHGKYSTYKENAFGLPSNGASVIYSPNGEYPLTDEGLAVYKTWITAQHTAGTPVILWYMLETPTTERIYLGDLKSYPQYTTLQFDGIFPPEASASLKIQEGIK